MNLKDLHTVMWWHQTLCTDSLNSGCASFSSSQKKLHIPHNTFYKLQSVYPSSHPIESPQSVDIKLLKHLQGGKLHSQPFILN